ncbi:MAG: pantoate--beta-alanine ligase [Pirellulales bacterium]|nr:pantoate--beta-alanine ligase [Pirellulales bacterium]
MSDVLSSSARPAVVTTISELRAAVAAARRRGATVGLVPTMGALHAGHASLIQAAHQECDFTVVSIFVNPTQFGPQEDFTRYPRTFDADRALVAEVGADLIFVPAVEAMYPAGFSTYVEPPAVAATLEGQSRPGHFRGVATVVLKLLNQVRPDIAYFGRKDFQQCAVVRRMVRDLDLDVRIVICPTVREADGLALSSRNRYLSADARRQALVLSRSLRLAAELVDAGERDANTILVRMREVIATAPEVRLEYVALVDPDTLAEVSEVSRPTAALLAARVGGTRLIDNELLGSWFEAVSTP